MGKIIDLKEEDYKIEDIDAVKEKSSGDKNTSRKKTSELNKGKKEKTKKFKMTKEEHTKIESKIRSLEKKRDLLYSEFYTDDSQEIREVNAELRKLYNKIPKVVKKKEEQKVKDKQTSKPKMTSEQIKMKSEIQKLENERDLLYSEFYTDDSQEIKEINQKLHNLYSKMPKTNNNKDNKDNKKDKEKTKVKLTPEQLKIKAEIEELENEKNLLYSQFYTDDSQEIKDIDEKLRKLYEKMPKNKKPEPKLTEGQLKIKAEIERLENERDLLYSQFYTDDSQEIKDIQAQIDKLYNEMKKPVKPEQKPNKEPKQKPNKGPEQKPNKEPKPKSHEEELEEFYNKYPGTRPNPEITDVPAIPKEGKIAKWFSNTWDRISNSIFGRAFKALVKGVKWIGKKFVGILKEKVEMEDNELFDEQDMEEENVVNEEMAKVEEELKRDVEHGVAPESQLSEEEIAKLVRQEEEEREERFGLVPESQISEEEIAKLFRQEEEERFEKEEKETKIAGNESKSEEKAKEEQLKTQKEMAREIRKIIKENEGKEDEVTAYKYEGVEIENTGSLKVIADYLDGKKKIQGKGRVVVSKDGEQLRLQPDGSLKHEKTLEERLRDNKAAEKVGTKENIEALQGNASKENGKNISPQLKEAMDKIKVNEDWNKGAR